VPRRRLSNPLNLPERVRWSHGQFYYVRGGKWDPLGSDVQFARDEGSRRNVGQSYGTVDWWYSEWLLSLRQCVGKPKAQRGISKRTFEDYTSYKAVLCAYFGKLQVNAVKPHHVASYLDLCAQTGRPSGGNHERAALSAMFTWLIRREESGVTQNPCRGVKRNYTSKRERYVTTDEFIEADSDLLGVERKWLKLIYYTLQRPSDVLRFTRSNIKNINGQRVFQFAQSKTGATMTIALTGDFGQIVDGCIGVGGVEIGPNMTLIHTKSGYPYTYSGLAGMIRRRLKKSGAQTFGPGDMKAKGATDMYQAGTPMETIQALCGHEKITTTQIYIKRHLQVIVEPNKVKLG
jgi:integrase